MFSLRKGIPERAAVEADIVREVTIRKVSGGEEEGGGK